MNYFQLLKQFYDLYDDMCNREVSKTVIMKKIKSAVPFKECIIFSVETMSLPPGKFNVSGLYDPDQDEQGKPPITIEIAFPKKHKFKFDEFHLRREHWAELCIDLASTLGHEFIHLNQFRKRNFEWTRVFKSRNANLKIREMQEYYGDKDELEAYAFMAAVELILDKIFENNQVIGPESTSVYKMYTVAFDCHDPVVKKLTKLINSYTKKLEKQYNETNFH